MNIKNYKISFIILLYLFSFAGHAADISAGKSRAVACQACHGADGNSTIPLHPSLAGQTSAYLETQLQHFKSGARINPTMQAQAAVLSDADIQNLAAYYAGLPAKSSGGEVNLAKQGQGKATMCMGCHGEKLSGRGQFPSLAGQQAAYLSKQLHDFKSGNRKAGAMNAFAQSLSDEDISTLSAYLANLNH
ncbi:cytochrome c4 [Methylomonas paludis]|uniref:Cytochrome c4 n=1 Tax=Methylomonas paludis TaxID=1173101 RepID=A0A975R922_9GAMM|nr:c-type cytochrome [Methylomonas paludis]QWF69784.1 cytochrome c4 [Methylomonas paludis]